MYRYIYWFKRRLPQNYKPVVLITGCGSGIGLALAHLFEKQNQYRVVVTARSKSLSILTKLFQENDRFLIRELDVCDDHSRRHLVSEIIERWGCVDILVNNAGISFRSVVEHMSESDERLQMTTNYFGPMELIKLVIPSMRTKGRGKIINVSSVSGMLAMPTMASYSASKYALEGATESLWYEMRPFGVDVSLIQPGFIHSNSFQNVYYSDKSKTEESHEGPYTEFYRSMAPFVEKLMGLSRSPPEKVAQLVLDVILTVRPPLWIPATFDAEFFYYLRRIFPRRLLSPFLFRCLPNVKKWGTRYTHKRKGFWTRVLSKILPRPKP